METDKVGGNITADLVESQSLWCRNCVEWRSLERLGAHRETRGAQGGLPEPPFVLYFRSPAHGSRVTSQPEIHLNFLIATWSDQLHLISPITRKVLTDSPIRLPPAILALLAV